MFGKLTKAKLELGKYLINLQAGMKGHTEYRHFELHWVEEINIFQTLNIKKCCFRRLCETKAM